ncbi:MAG: hypothetical protein RKO24_00940 [Candidatus Competibacter sp.]|nr:hypothetical protein [Candidatus Competibacter sp.]
MLVALSAVLTALANLLLRGGVLGHGGLSLAPDKVGSDLLGLLTQPLFVAGVFFYGLAAVVWFSVLAIENLSTSYPVLVGLAFVLVGSGAIFFFSESLSIQKLCGMAIILGGIAVVARA